MAAKFLGMLLEVKCLRRGFFSKTGRDLKNFQKNDEKTRERKHFQANYIWR
jgi:hypothetical protein